MPAVKAVSVTFAVSELAGVEYMVGRNINNEAYFHVQYCEDKRRNMRPPRIVRSGVIMKQQAADLTRGSDDEALGELDRNAYLE